jgi:hypothetical protein
MERTFHMRKHLGLKSLLLAGLLGLLGCANPPQGNAPASPQPRLSFVDIDAFDRDLAASLRADLGTVEVQFFEKVSPNALPPRLQKWLQTAEGTGGRVQVDPPEGELVARNPLALLSLFGTLFSSAKAALQIQQEAQLNAAREHDVHIVLERSTDGRVLVQKVTFKKKRPA